MSTDTNQPVITVATASDIVAAEVNNTNVDVSSLSGGTDPTSVKDATLEHVILRNQIIRNLHVFESF